MDKFPNDFDMGQVMKLAQSETGQQLLALLQNSGDPKFGSAMDQAAMGNLEPARQMLQQLMANEQTRGLLQKIAGDANG